MGNDNVGRGQKNGERGPRRQTTFSAQKYEEKEQEPIKTGVGVCSPQKMETHNFCLHRLLMISCRIGGQKWMNCHEDLRMKRKKEEAADGRAAAELTEIIVSLVFFLQKTRQKCFIVQK
uniref:Uncharacterized protein n=1 Tax=Caenorhabditis tropicalis TaxID=1561998 RepID=A0A1I7UA96_9PELO